MTKWYERSLRRLSRRDRKKVLRTPALRAAQRTWQAARIERLNAAFKARYRSSVEEMLAMVPRSRLFGMLEHDPNSSHVYVFPTVAT